MKRISVICLLILGVVSALAQGHRIEVQVEGLDGQRLMLGNHYGNVQYVNDSILLDATGKGVFSGPEALEQGIYLLVFPDNNYLEILMGEDQRFSVFTDTTDYFGRLEFAGSAENEAFLAYQRGMQELETRYRDLSRQYQAANGNPGRQGEIRGRLTALEEKREQLATSYRDRMPGSLLAYLIEAMMPVDIPGIQVSGSQANPDSVRQLKRYLYHKEHYFDRIDFSDPRILRTPIYHNKLESFFSRMVLQSPDSLNKEIDTILEKCMQQKDFFRYTLVFLFNKYRESKVMGHDAVVLKLADDYYLSGKAEWADSVFLKNLREDADLIRYNQIGNQAVDLTMETYRGDFRSVHDIPAEYTVLYFWEPDCGHCKTVTPELINRYPEFREEQVEIFAVCTTDNREEWEQYIAEHQLEWINGWDPDRQTHYDFYYNVRSTPMFYILDSEKTIIAKRIGYEQLLDFIRNHRKRFSGR